MLRKTTVHIPHGVTQPTALGGGGAEVVKIKVFRFLGFFFFFHESHLLSLGTLGFRFTSLLLVMVSYTDKFNYFPHCTAIPKYQIPCLRQFIEHIRKCLYPVAAIHSNNILKF